MAKAAVALREWLVPTVIIPVSIAVLIALLAMFAP